MPHSASNQRSNQKFVGRWLTQPALLAGTLALLATLAVTSAILYSSVAEVHQHESAVSHTYDVLAQIEDIGFLSQKLVASYRGYAIAGSNEFLASDATDRVELNAGVSNLRHLTRDNPEQTPNHQELDQATREILTWSDRIIDTRRLKGETAAFDLLRTGTGKVLTDRVDSILARMRLIEKSLFQQRETQAKASWDRLLRTLVISSTANFLLIFIAFALIRKAMKAQNAEAEKMSQETWHRTCLAELALLLRGEQSPKSFGEKALDFFAKHIGAEVGSFYVEEAGRLKLAAAFAGDGQAKAKETLAGGEGLLGEAFRKKRTIVIDEPPSDYIKIMSSLGSTPPKQILAMPLIYEEEVRGVLEIGALNHLGARERRLAEAAQESLGIALNAAESRSRLQALLEATQRQAEELQAQQEELKTSNEELEAQTSALRASQERLQVQQEELRQTNEELEQQAKALDLSRKQLTGQNIELERAKKSLEQKAQELEISSRYKSEFLANMSHELRTPLNSLLILATLLAENKEHNLSDKQVEFARTIYKAGADLLALINDILDLSKVEAGKLVLNPEPVQLAALIAEIERSFRPQAETKGLKFTAQIAKPAPELIQTDKQRLEQIVRNFLANAIKFTSSGTVTISVEPGNALHPLAIAVKDTGIGIPEDKQDLIFEAFQQVDASTSRAYGGTGLGLTISRELATLLGGYIKVTSAPGRGSEFTLFLPKSLPEKSGLSTNPSPRPLPLAHREPAKSKAPGSALTGPRLDLSGDIGNIASGDRVALIVEDDPDFGRSLASLARESGFKAVVAQTGQSGLAYAGENVVHAILLDVKLPDVSGLSVLERLKRNARTRHVPIHIVSGADHSANALSLGAIGYLVKPATPEQLRGAFAKIEGILAKQVKRILVVEDDQIQRDAVRQLLGNGDLKIDQASSAVDALDYLTKQAYDCLILDLKLPDMSGFELLDRLDQASPKYRPPVVVYTGKDLTQEEQERLERHAESIVIKGARSPERLLDEVGLFLHRVESSLPPDSRALLERLRTEDVSLKDRRVLLVDDDMRNVFALVNAFDASGIKTAVARSGKEALQKLEQTPPPELILMDIMMPEMDGYEAMRRIRVDARFKKLPIIALTAKAMREDHENSLAAGANDYLPKPVNLERLLSLLKVWLPKRLG